MVLVLLINGPSSGHTWNRRKGQRCPKFLITKVIKYTSGDCFQSWVSLGRGGQFVSEGIKTLGQKESFIRVLEGSGACECTMYQWAYGIGGEICESSCTVEECGAVGGPNRRLHPQWGRREVTAAQPQAWDNKRHGRPKSALIQTLLKLSWLVKCPD